MYIYQPAVKALSIWVTLLLLSSAHIVYAQGDNGNGTYTNPIIWADFPDNDVIRVGDTYYMVTITANFFPGAPVMESKDLVNWKYLSNSIERIPGYPVYNMQGGTRYSHGQ